jgi:hypothetical protein
MIMRKSQHKLRTVELKAFMYFNSLASGWDPGIEFTILSEMGKLAEKTGITKIQSSIIRK